MSTEGGAWKRLVPPASLSAWLVVSAYAQEPAPRLIVDNPAGCPIEIVEATLAIASGADGDEEPRYSIVTRNASRKKIVHFHLEWSTLSASGARLGTVVEAFVPDKPLKPERTYRQTSAGPEIPRTVETIRLAPRGVRFADRSIWDADERRTTRTLAENGDPEAQYRLGLMYRDGQGVSPDRVWAYVWLKLAAISEHPRAAAARDEVAAKMTPEEIHEGDLLARETVLTHFTDLLGR
jgi:hypothetical protein